MKQCGVYAFFDGDRCLYVGRSKNLKERIAKYFYKSTGRYFFDSINKDAYFAIHRARINNKLKIYIHETNDYQQAEIDFHNILKPEYNKVTPGIFNYT